MEVEDFVSYAEPAVTSWAAALARCWRARLVIIQSEGEAACERVSGAHLAQPLLIRPTDSPKSIYVPCSPPPLR